MSTASARKLTRLVDLVKEIAVKTGSSLSPACAMWLLETKWWLCIISFVHWVVQFGRKLLDLVVA